MSFTKNGSNEEPKGKNISDSSLSCISVEESKSMTGKFKLTIANEKEIFLELTSLNSLSELEKTLLYWFLISPKDWSVNELEANIPFEVEIKDIEDSLLSLKKKNLIDQVKIDKEKKWRLNVFVSQDVLQSYQAQLAGRVVEEIQALEISWLDQYPLVRASDPEYIKQKQISNILLPSLNFLIQKYGKEKLDKRLQEILRYLRNISQYSAYAAGNIVDMLGFLRNCHFNGNNFSDLTLWETNFRDVELHNVNFKNSDLTDSSFINSDIGKILSLDISSDGKLLALGGTKGYICIHDLETGEELYRHTRNGAWSCVWSLKFHPTENIIASGGDDGCINLWWYEEENRFINIDQQFCQSRRIESHQDSIRALDFNKDGSILASGSGDATVGIWLIDLIINSENLSKVSSCGYRLKPEENLDCNQSVRSVLFYQNGILISGSLDGSISVWNQDLLEGKYQLKKRYDYDLGKVRSQVFYPHDTECILVSSHGEGCIVVSKLDSHKGEIIDKNIVLSNDNFHHNCVVNLAFSHNGEKLVTADEKGKVAIWRTRYSEELLSFKIETTIENAHNNWIRQVKFIDNKHFVTGSFDISAKVWRDSGQCLKTIKGFSNTIWAAIYTKNGNYIISGHDDNSIRVFDSSNFELIKTFWEHQDLIRSLSINCDGSILATASYDFTVKIWNISDPDPNQWKYLHTFRHKSWVRCVEFHPKKANILASCGDDNKIEIWDVFDRRSLQTIKKNKQEKGHTDPIRTIAFSDSGNYLVSGGGDKIIYVWELDRQKLYKYFDSKPFECKDLKERVQSIDWVRSIVFLDEFNFVAGGGNKVIYRSAIVYKIIPGKGVFAQNFKDNSKLSIESGLEHKFPLLCLAYNSKTKWLAMSGVDDVVKLWNFESNKYFEFRKNKNYYSDDFLAESVQTLAWHPKLENVLLGGDRKGLFYIWQIERESGFLKEKPIRPIPLPYNKTNITGVVGLTDSQIKLLKKLGCYDEKEKAPPHDSTKEKNEQTIKEVSLEIKKILDQLNKNQRRVTKKEQQDSIDALIPSLLRSRTIKALKTDWKEVLEKFLDNSDLSIGISLLESWEEAWQNFIK